MASRPPSPSVFNPRYPVSAVVDHQLITPSDQLKVQELGLPHYTLVLARAIEQEYGDLVARQESLLAKNKEAHEALLKLNKGELVVKGELSRLKEELAAKDAKLKEKDVLFEEHGFTIVEQFEGGFAHALGQISFLHPDVDISAVGPFKEVVNGKLGVSSAWDLTFEKFFGSRPPLDLALGLRFRVPKGELFGRALRSLCPRGTLSIILSGLCARGRPLRPSSQVFVPERDLFRRSLRSSTDPLYVLDLEIEITLRRLRKARNIVVSGSSSSVSSSDNSSHVTNNSNSVEYDSTNTFAELEQMENNDKTLKELATLDMVYQPWRRPPQAFEGIPCGLFHNEAAGDTRGLHQNKGVPILPGWSSKRLVGDMKCTVLEKFFPASRTATIRKEICGIRQHPGETLDEYWERFNKLCATCPHHHITEQLLIQYFYEGLSMMD
ncbi:hypothetical protein CR513_54112, partial [Mucuna pruriens]